MRTDCVTCSCTLWHCIVWLVLVLCTLYDLFLYSLWHCIVWLVPVLCTTTDYMTCTYTSVWQWRESPGRLTTWSIVSTMLILSSQINLGLHYGCLDDLYSHSQHNPPYRPHIKTTLLHKCAIFHWIQLTIHLYHESAIYYTQNIMFWPLITYLH